MAVQLVLVKIIAWRSLAGRVDKFIKNNFRSELYYFITSRDGELDQC